MPTGSAMPLKRLIRPNDEEDDPAAEGPAL
jgi:hypothetical protein